MFIQSFTAVGFDISEDEIFTSLTAARRLVETEKLNPLLLLEDSAQEDFEGLHTNNSGEHNCVVVGVAPSHFDYSHLNQAFRCVIHLKHLLGTL